MLMINCLGAGEAKSPNISLEARDQGDQMKIFRMNILVLGTVHNSGWKSFAFRISGGTSSPSMYYLW